MGGALADVAGDEAAAEVELELELLEHAAAVTTRGTAAMNHVVLRILPSQLLGSPPLPGDQRDPMQAIGVYAADPRSGWTRGQTPPPGPRGEGPPSLGVPVRVRDHLVRVDRKGRISTDMDCHGSGDAAVATAERPIVLVGNPNVGKSALFGRMTG